MLESIQSDLDEILARTPALWNKLRCARLFVTGGTGFFGAWLLSSVVWANRHLGTGIEAVVLTRSPERAMARFPYFAAEPCLRFIAGDVREFDPPEGPFTHIIHAATDTAVAAANRPVDYTESIVLGTTNVLRFAVKAGVESVLLTSSGAAYGQLPTGITHIPEDFQGINPLDPRLCYGHGKQMSELLAVAYEQQYGLKTKIARCFAFVGPYQDIDSHFAVTNFIRDTLSGNHIRLSGTGTVRRSYLYAADLVTWLWTILVDGEAARLYNVGSDHAVSIADLARLTVRTLNPDLKVHIPEVAAQEELRPDYVPSIVRARQELGLDVWTELPEAIRRAHDWYRAAGVPAVR